MCIPLEADSVNVTLRSACNSLRSVDLTNLLTFTIHGMDVPIASSSFSGVFMSDAFQVQRTIFCEHFALHSLVYLKSQHRITNRTTLMRITVFIQEILPCYVLLKDLVVSGVLLSKARKLQSCSSQIHSAVNHQPSYLPQAIMN